jgi:DNA replication protein DnaC
VNSLEEILANLATGKPTAMSVESKCARCGERPVERSGSWCDVCEAERRRAHRVALVRVARESIPSTFRDLDAQEVRRRVRIPETTDQAEGAKAHVRVVLVGASGFGKTTLACWMLQQVIDRGVVGTPEELERARWARFVDAPKLALAEREHPLGEGEAPLLRSAHRASVLVLDDVGQELGLRLAVNPVVDVIRERHAAGRATWVTTFLEPDAFEKAYGSGTARRVFDGGVVLSLGDGS